MIALFFNSILTSCLLFADLTPTKEEKGRADVYWCTKRVRLAVNWMASKKRGDQLFFILFFHTMLQILSSLKGWHLVMG